MVQMPLTVIPGWSIGTRNRLIPWCLGASGSVRAPTQYQSAKWADVVHVFCSRLPQPPSADLAAAIRLWGTLFSNTALTWSDLAWLRRQTRLPILLKGILHPDDARLALDHGVDAIIVSNHGGRQVDGAIAALDALPAVAAAIQQKIPILFDGGIRYGADAIKALALGARAVLLARLYVWGLAIAGEQGVRDVVQNFLADLDLTMGLSGLRSVRELDASILTLER